MALMDADKGQVSDASVWARMQAQGAYESFTVGTSTITSGTDGRVLYDNNGVLGEKAVTGTGNAVLATSPTLVTPVLGVATATSVNKVTVTAPATGSTLTIADGKTFTVNQTLTFTGTTGQTFTFPASTDTVGCLGTAQTWSAANVFSSKLTFKTATTGLLAGSGAAAGRTALGATAGNALEFYLDATHTTGDMRGVYANLTFSGIGGSGEALRAFGVVNNKTVATLGTVNGAHISLDFVGADAKISGAGNALRATFGISDAAATAVGGTCSTIQVDTYFDNAITVPPRFAFMRFTDSGVKVSANLFKLPNAINGAALLFSAHTDQVMTHSLKCVSEDGTIYYLMATTVATGRS